MDNNKEKEKIYCAGFLVAERDKRDTIIQSLVNAGVDKEDIEPIEDTIEFCAEDFDEKKVHEWLDDNEKDIEDYTFYFLDDEDQHWRLTRKDGRESQIGIYPSMSIKQLILEGYSAEEARKIVDIISV